MQAVSPDYLSMLAGSHQQVVRADAWFAGRLVYADLPIADGSISMKVGQQVRSTLSITLRDSDGSLTPRLDGPLSPYGGEIVVRAGMKRRGITEMVPMGRFQINEPETDETWKVYTSKHGEKIRRSRGGTTSIQSMPDAMCKVIDQAFLTRVQPTQATVMQEIARILRGVAPWRPPTGVADKALAASAVTYSDDRAQALTDLAALLQCDAFADTDGAITLAPKAVTTPSVWTVPRGQDGGQILSFTRRLTRVNVHNVWIAQGTAFDGSPLRGYAYDTTPGVAYAGPFGRVAAFVDAPLAASQADIDRAAAAAMAAEMKQRRQEIGLQVVTNYALRCNDVITVELPRGSITGPVTGIEFPLKPSTGMDITMSVDPFLLAQVS